MVEGDSCTIEVIGERFEHGIHSQQWSRSTLVYSLTSEGYYIGRVIPKGDEFMDEMPPEFADCPEDLALIPA